MESFNHRAPSSANTWTWHSCSSLELCAGVAGEAPHLLLPRILLSWDLQDLSDLEIKFLFQCVRETPHQKLFQNSTSYKIHQDRHLQEIGVLNLFIVFQFVHCPFQSKQKCSRFFCILNGIFQGWGSKVV